MWRVSREGSLQACQGQVDGKREGCGGCERCGRCGRAVAAHRLLQLLLSSLAQPGKVWSVKWCGIGVSDTPPAHAPAAVQLVQRPCSLKSSCCGYLKSCLSRRPCWGLNGCWQLECGAAQPCEGGCPAAADSAESHGLEGWMKQLLPPPSSPALPLRSPYLLCLTGGAFLCVFKSELSGIWQAAA